MIAHSRSGLELACEKCLLAHAPLWENFTALMMKRPENWANDFEAALEGFFSERAKPSGGKDLIFLHTAALLVLHLMVEWGREPDVYSVSSILRQRLAGCEQTLGRLYKRMNGI